MSQIDDPIEAVKKQYPEEPGGPISVMLDLIAELHPFAGIANVFREFRSQAEQRARIKPLFEAVEWYVRQHERKIDELELEEQIRRPEAKEALIAAVRETLLSSDLNKVKRFAAIVGHGFLTNGNKTDWENAAAYIRDLSPTWRF